MVICGKREWLKRQTEVKLWGISGGGKRKDAIARELGDWARNSNGIILSIA